MAFHAQCDQVFEMIGFGVRLAGLPPAHSVPGKSKQIG
jgi:hypothetical protein